MLSEVEASSQSNSRSRNSKRFLDFARNDRSFVKKMEFEKNTMLFGADSTPGIVAIALGETGTVNVYRRKKDGSTVVDVEPFHPFVWCDSDVVDLGIEAEKLEGDLKYGWLVTVDSWKELIALRNGLKNAGSRFLRL